MAVARAASRLSMGRHAFRDANFWVPAARRPLSLPSVPEPSASTPSCSKRPLIEAIPITRGLPGRRAIPRHFITFEAALGGEVALAEMAIYNTEMDISVTTFKAHCLDLIRKVEERGETITIRRRGRIVARLEPANGGSSDGKPWERLRALGGSANITAKDSAWKDEDFEALC